MASFRPERRAPGDYGDMKGITQEPLIAAPSSSIPGSVCSEREKTVDQ